MIMQLQAAEFQQLLGASLQEVAAANFNRKLLSAVKVDGTALSALLSSSDISRLLDALVEETFRDGQALVEEGITGDAFYIVTSGTATVSTRVKGELTVIGAGEHFGEMALVRAEPRAATVTAQGPLKALVLSRITFTRLLGPLQVRLALEMDPNPNPNPNLHLLGSRRLTLWMTVIVMWAIVACYIVVLEQHARVNGRPQENNMNILALVSVYITFMPGEG